MGMDVLHEHFLMVLPYHLFFVFVFVLVLVSVGFFFFQGKSSDDISLYIFFLLRRYFWLPVETGIIISNNYLISYGYSETEMIMIDPASLPMGKAE